MTPDRLISSDLRRAMHTADIIGDAAGIPVKLDPRLRETHLGEWQGRTVGEIEQTWPGAIAYWRSDPAWAPPGGESRIDVVRRSGRSSRSWTTRCRVRTPPRCWWPTAA